MQKVANEPNEVEVIYRAMQIGRLHRIKSVDTIDEFSFGHSTR